VESVPVKPPGEEVAVYNVIVEPPSLAGAVYATVAVVPPVAVAVPIVGAPGTLAVVTLFDAALAGPVPIILVAVTVNVYEVLADKPLTVTVPEPAWLNVPVIPPGEEVAV
jgi:hypothetical protein